jgi:photosystem II stability/assembly factor-like uncharacterized protein
VVGGKVIEDLGVRAAVIVLIVMLGLGLGRSPGLAPTRVVVHALDFIYMTDARSGWAATDIDEVLHTIDGGAHWTDVTPISAAGQKNSRGVPRVLTSLIAWVQSCTLRDSVTVELCTLLRTADGGRTWRSLGPLPMFRTVGNPAPFAVGGTYNFVDARHGWFMIGLGALGSMDVDIHRTADGGHSWTKVASDNTRDERSGLPFGGQKLGITFLNTATGWITGYIAGCDHTYFFVTQDGGRTWQEQRFPVPPQVTSRWNGYTMSPMFFSARDGVLPVFFSYSIKGENCEAGKTVMVFYTTHDGGNGWEDTTPIAVHGRPPSSFVDVNHGWLATGNTLYQTIDGGHQWSEILLPQTFADIKLLDFVSPQVGWATREAPPFLLKTADGGHTWAPLTYTISRP